MKYQVLVLDLDGTLTNSRKEITEPTKSSDRDPGGRQDRCPCQRPPDQRSRPAGGGAPDGPLRRIYALL